MIPTPEFLIWSLEQPCSLRQINNWTDPEQTERHLRAVRAASEAYQTGRVRNGIAIDGLQGFRIAEALALFGGEVAIAAACEKCPANAFATATESSHAWANCHGQWALPLAEEDANDFRAAFQAGILATCGMETWESQFFPSSPSWYGVWTAKRLTADHCRLLLAVIEPFSLDQPGLKPLRASLQASVQHNLVLHVRLYPAGHRTATQWIIPSHCARCSAPWQNSPPAANPPRCAVCSFVCHPLPQRKRRARGTRPYSPLASFLPDA